MALHSTVYPHGRSRVARHFFKRRKHARLVPNAVLNHERNRSAAGPFIQHHRHSAILEISRGLQLIAQRRRVGLGRRAGVNHLILGPNRDRILWSLHLVPQCLHFCNEFLPLSGVVEITDKRTAKNQRCHDGRTQRGPF